MDETTTEYEYKAERRIHIESFMNWQDASTFVERYLDEYHGTQWYVEEAEVVYVNHRFRACVSVSIRQGDLFRDES